MSDRRKEIFRDFLEQKSEKETEYLVGEVYFSDRRGYYLSVQPQTEKKENGYTMTGFMLFSGESIRIEQSARFNAKRLAAIVPDPKLVEEMKARVLQKRADDKAKHDEAIRRHQEEMKAKSEAERIKTCDWTVST